MFGKKMPLREDIAAAAAASKISRTMFGKTLWRMESKLMNGEQVEAMAAVNHDGRAGVLVHTNYRVWFTADSVAGNASDSVAIERISSVQWERAMGARGGTMVIGTPSRMLHFTLVPETFAANLQAVTA